MARTVYIEKIPHSAAEPQADLTGQCVFEGGDQEQSRKALPGLQNQDNKVLICLGGQKL